MRQQTETVAATAPRAVIEFLARDLSRQDAEIVAERLPGLTLRDLRNLDELLREAHGLQTEVEVAYEDGRLHYRATGPVRGFGSLESWHVKSDCTWPAQTHGLQWSGYDRRRIGATAGRMVQRLG